MSARDAIPSGRKTWKRWRTVGLNLAGAASFLFALTFLPPDNSLSDVQASGVLRVCVPESLPPLITDDPAAPGYDLAMLDLIARDIGVRLAINRNSAIGSDFNPRNWRLTRAQCQVIAGGVVDNSATRGFLELLPTGIKTGWAMAISKEVLLQDGATLGVFPGPSSLDRVALSRYLRSNNLKTAPASSSAQLTHMFQGGAVDAIISDRLTLSALDLPDADVRMMEEGGLQEFDLAFGLWKGDATLLRAIRKSRENLMQTGLADALAAQYHISVDAKSAP